MGDVSVEQWGGREEVARYSCMARVDRVRAGLPYTDFEALRGALGVSQIALAEVLSIQPRTLARRRRSGKLEADESDRLQRASRVFEHATHVLGDAETAAAWMGRPNRALAGAAPLSLLDTDIGVREVDEILGRIEYGIHA